MYKGIGIFGASGFAREVADIVFELSFESVVFLDRTTRKCKYFGLQLLPESEAISLSNRQFAFSIGISNNVTRKHVHYKFKTLVYPNLVHPLASFGRLQKEELQLRQGNIIAAGARFTNNIRIGNFGIYNLNCTIGHDCVIEDYVQIAPGASISGNVHLKEGAFVGSNACIIQGKSIDNKLTIGRNAVVGAGAVVTRSVTDSIMVTGVPARRCKH